MIFNFLLLASSLLGTFFVDALPTLKTTSIDLSSPPAGQVIISNGNNGSIWTVNPPQPWPTQIYVPVTDGSSYEAFVWNATQVGVDTWVFQSTDTQKWIQANATNNNIVAGDYPTVFAVNSAGGGEYVIKLPDADLVWDAVYTPHISLEPVVLEPADGNVTQHWSIQQL
ncbi:hypothetical protein B0H11DRAFT_2141213 [Mycena galericulata]|nr:hypothetical protein B0H11DRAFT_2141213 [Mycena galericulata]